MGPSFCDTGFTNQSGHLVSDRVSRQIRIRMSARPTDEPHRVASQLELLSDLTFVIAIAILTGHFAHAVAVGHALEELVPFLQVFFAIWWAWVNFTWFGSSFDTDDVPFRLLTIVQMARVLILAAGVPAAFEHGDLTAVTFGYVIIRVGLVAHWLRAAIKNPSSRGTALRYAIGITLATGAGCCGWGSTRPECCPTRRCSGSTRRS
jgi:low temperature requirement protein LtrA